MVDQVKILAARRAYEFRLDDLRLTALGIGEVPHTIQRYFDFQTVQISTPQPTFGPVANTIPPGLVCRLGSIRCPDGSLVAIRYINFEAQRIVIDVAGPSSAIDQVYEQLREILAEVRAPDGLPAMGDPVRTLDESEISARLSFEVGRLISEPLSASVQRALAEDESDIVIPSAVVLQVASPLSEIAQPSWGQVVLQTRAGSKIGERIYFCNADLTTERTLAWLEDLDRELGARQREFTQDEVAREE